MFDVLLFLIVALAIVAYGSKWFLERAFKCCE
jgi:hypothetical protein